MQDRTVRLNKYLASLGIGARRDIKLLLKQQLVTINGVRATEKGTRIDPQKDKIRINGNIITPPILVYFILNKPKGIISTTSDEYGRHNVISLIPQKQRIYPVGRLDKDTTGLLILTNDGTLTNLLTHPKYHVNKVYRLIVAGRVNKAQQKALTNGVLLEDGITAPAKLRILNIQNTQTALELTIHEGKNRQIRRMCIAVGLELLQLQRTQYGPISIGELGLGKYRVLGHNEVELLRKAATNYSGSTKNNLI